MIYTHPERPDYWCQEIPGGGFLGWPKSSRPGIFAKHIDGPLLTARNGEMHWLTVWERILFRLGRTDARRLERKYWPELADLGT